MKEERPESFGQLCARSGSAVFRQETLTQGEFLRSRLRDRDRGKLIYLGGAPRGSGLREQGCEPRHRSHLRVYGLSSSPQSALG